MVRLASVLLFAAASFCSAERSDECRVENDEDDTVPVNPILDDDYPRAHNANVVAHDPNIIFTNDHYYLFKGGVGISSYKADSLNGPWEDIGPLLDGPSVIPKENQTRPWAPTVLKGGDTYYCYYTISLAGCHDSAIGVATTKDVESSDWHDHGAVIQTGLGPGTDVSPFDRTNAIDAQIFVDPKDDQAYLNYGSYWSGIWQVPLSDDWLSVVDLEEPDATQLATLTEGQNNIEGVFMTYREPWYYLWYSRGKCCHWEEGDVEKGGEYHIRVARSKSATGPFVDDQGTSATEGGGVVVYASNHDNEVFAPGGLGILPRKDYDVLYFHYLNVEVGLGHMDAYLGYSYLEYIDGWPVAQYEKPGDILPCD